MEDGSVPNIRLEFVLDPLNRRGKGTVPNHRKGYRKSKKRKGNVCQEPGHTHEFFLREFFTSNSTAMSKMREFFNVFVCTSVTNQLIKPSQ